MKCTQCGCNKLIKIDSPFYTIDGRVQTSAKIYTCYECGHLEFFDFHPYRSKVSELEIRINQLNELKQKLAELENPIELNLLKADYETIEKELSSLDITIRQQQELNSKLCELKLKIQNYPQEIKKLKNKISELENQIQGLKEYISNTVIITEKE